MTPTRSGALRLTLIGSTVSKLPPMALERGSAEVQPHFRFTALSSSEIYLSLAAGLTLWVSAGSHSVEARHRSRTNTAGL